MRGYCPGEVAPNPREEWKEEEEESEQKSMHAGKGGVPAPLCGGADRRGGERRRGIRAMGRRREDESG